MITARFIPLFRVHSWPALELLEPVVGWCGFGNSGCSAGLLSELCVLGVLSVRGGEHSGWVYLPQNASCIVLSYILVWWNQFCGFLPEKRYLALFTVHFSFCSLIFLTSQESCLPLLRECTCLKSFGKPSQLLMWETLWEYFITHQPVLLLNDLQICCFSSAHATGPKIGGRGVWMLLSKVYPWSVLLRGAFGQYL